VNISSVAWETPPPATVGSRISFVAHFLGRRIAFTYEVRELVDAERFVMSTAQSPVPDEDDLHLGRHPRRWYPNDAANQGEPSGFGQLTAQ
jgi:hypothetical protein